MVVKIKLQRKGSKSKPFYRVVVQAGAAARDGDVIEILGKYHPLKEPTLFEIDREKAREWLAKGAQPTEKTRILLGKAGIMQPVDLAALPKRKPKAEGKEEKPPAEKKEEKKENLSAEAPAEVGAKAQEEVKQPEKT